MTPTCPSDVRLEAHLLGGARDLAAHIDSCESCQARLAGLRADSAEFRARLYPRTIDAVLARSEPTRFWRWLLSGAGVALAAAAVLIVGRPAPTAETGLQTKGYARPQSLPTRPLPFDVYVADRAGVRKAGDGARIAPDAQLRFTVNPPERCWFSVVSIDGTGQVARLYPAEPDGIEVPHPQLPGGAILDGRSGPERLFALCSRNPLREADVQSAGRAAAAADLHQLARLPGLPKDVLQSTVLLEKVP